MRKRGSVGPRRSGEGYEGQRRSEGWLGFEKKKRGREVGWGWRT